MSDERFISNISADQTCKRRAQVFMTDFLQNELHECNFILAKVNQTYNFTEQPEVTNKKVYVKRKKQEILEAGNLARWQCTMKVFEKIYQSVPRFPKTFLRQHFQFSNRKSIYYFQRAITLETKFFDSVSDLHLS